MEKEKSGGFKYLVYFIGLVVCGLVVWGFMEMFNNYIIIPRNKRKIRENPVLVNGAVVTKIQNINKISDAYMFTFSFHIGDQLLTNKHSIGLEFKSNSVNNATNYLMSRSLPVMYEKENPKNSRLLIAPKDFEYFEIQFPDSLKWIKVDVIN